MPRKKKFKQTSNISKKKQGSNFKPTTQTYDMFMNPQCHLISVRESPCIKTNKQIKQKPIKSQQKLDRNNNVVKKKGRRMGMLKTRQQIKNAEIEHIKSHKCIVMVKQEDLLGLQQQWKNKESPESPIILWQSIYNDLMSWRYSQYWEEKYLGRVETEIDSD